MKRSNLILTVLTVTALLAGAFWLVPDCALVSNWNGFRGFHPRGAMMGWGGMGIMMLIFWGAVLIMLVMVVSRLFRFEAEKKAGTAENPTASEILKQRYARGEIDKNEFQAKMNDIGLPPKP